MRSTFSGSERSAELYIGSVKDNIGHAEAASGVAGVIKALLMMRYRSIPKQANFQILNPSIRSSPYDKITVPQKTHAWTATRRIALVNNYGAAGSNAAIVLREHNEIFEPRQLSNGTVSHKQSAVIPIFLSARSANGLKWYISAMESYLPKDEISLKNFAYNLCLRQNPSFEYRVGFTVTDRADLLSKLEENGAESPPVSRSPGQLPVVLCFGGQTGSSIHLSREVYEESKLLRKHLVRILSSERL